MISSSYPTNQDYLENALKFLKKHQWLYNYVNTEILNRKYFDLIPETWVQSFKNLEVDFANKLLPEGAEGYLSFLLYKNFKYRVLAVEGNKKFIELALKRQKEEYPDSTAYVKYVNHFITKDSLNELSVYVQESFSEEIKRKPSVCIVGLHACADLSIVILDIFSKMDVAKALAIMPCCYHRLSQTEDGQFYNFPASDMLKKLNNRHEGDTFLKVPFLRLACQQTYNSHASKTGPDREKQAISWMMRAILQEISVEENCIVRRLKRKSGKIKHNLYSSIVEDYIDKLNSTHKLIRKETVDMAGAEKLIDESLLKEKFIEKWSYYKGKCEVLEFLATFQSHIQTICENVVLLDRVEFLRERGICCRSYKVTDDRLSPRCYALVAAKT